MHMRFFDYNFSFLPQLVIVPLLVFITVPELSQAQSFDEGIKLYQQGKYAQATKIFDNIDTDKGRLFSGKTYFGLGKYLTAKSYLGQVSKQESEKLFLEAQYTLALTDFQLGLFDNALNRLYRFKERNDRTQLVSEGINLYNDILDYLTMNQRKNAFQQAEHPQIKYDLVSSVFGDIPYSTAKTLYSQLVKSKIDTTTPPMRELSKMISDSLSYAVEMAYNNRPQAPEGIVYNIGAALPTYKNNASEFKISQGLYFGYVLAAEEFNRQHTNKKAFIRYQNTGAQMDSARYAMTDLAWNYSVDAVLGPLFSEPAQKMADLAEQYQIPMIAPLANSDTLNIDNPYVYQANPTFTSHGRKMAEYAVQNLQMDTLAVLTEKNSLGEASAYAFRDRAEKLGAKVSYFFVDNLESKGFDLTEYTKYFTSDSAKIDSLGYHHLDAVYAPFTGQAAPTLAELLLVDLDAINNDLTVLGSQEWGNLKIAEVQETDRDIYFSESYYINKKSQQVEQFKERFKRRFDMEPNRFAMIGYDAASYLLQTLNRVANPALLKDALKQQPLYQGLINNINFGGTHINQEVKIFTFTEGGVRPVLKNQ